VASRHAIEIAGRQGAKTFELRAATEFAEFLRNEGREKKGLEVLAPICQEFSKGLTGPMPMRARALVGE
jgi:hypothetical protein